MTEARTPQQIQRYVTKALRIIEREALFSAGVDWPALHREARETAATSRSFAGTHRLLARAVKQAGGQHSHIVPPYSYRPGKQATDPPRQPTAPVGPARRAAASDSAPFPVGRLIDTVAYFELPKMAGGHQLARRYNVVGSALVDELAATRPSGWVVDLRDNTGGGMWPMLAVVASLLDPGVIGNFAGPDGRMQPWRLHRSYLSLGLRPRARVRTRTRRPPHTPVAVLTSGRTASAGEAVLVALRAQSPVRTIGKPTAGMTTGNSTHLLPDGTRLMISGAHYADAAGNLVTGRMIPDEEIDDTAGDDTAGDDTERDDNERDDTERDAALIAALRWIPTSLARGV